MCDLLEHDIFGDWTEYILLILLVIPQRINEKRMPLHVINKLLS